jgi:hypothetical protein
MTYNNLYTCFDNYPELCNSYIQEALSCNYTEHHRPHDYRAGCSFNSSNFINILKNNIGDVSALWIKNPPNTIYDWHIDNNIRQCSINFVIQQSVNSIAMYREPIPQTGTDRIIYYKIHKVKYVLYKPTVLNVKEEHSVINPSDQDRIILSLCVKESSYKQTVNFMNTFIPNDY